MHRRFRFALAIVLATALAACSNPPAQFTTQLDRGGGIGPGDPVVHGAARIGEVTGVSPLSDGDTEVSFQVQGDYTNEVHQDAIMLLNAQPGTPSLEVLNQDAMSSKAQPGMRLDGATDMNQVQLIMMSRGPGSLATALSNASGAFPGSNIVQPSTTTQQMQQMFSQITQQTAAMAMAMSPPTRADVAAMQSDAKAVERQFNRNGKPDQAGRVQDQMNQIQNTYGIKVTPAPPPP